MRIYAEGMIEQLECEIRRDQRIVRILKRVGHVFKRHGIGVSIGDGTVSVSCPSVEKCEWAAAKLHVPLNLVYIGSQARRECVVQSGSIVFHFFAGGVREILLTDCHVKRQRKPLGASRRAHLYFHDKEIADTMYWPGSMTPQQLKESLWTIAHTRMDGKDRYKLID